MKTFLIHAIHYQTIEYIEPGKNIEEFIQEEFSEFTSVKNCGSTIEPETVEVEINDIIDAKDDEDLLEQINNKFPHGLDTIFSLWEMVNQRSEQDFYND